MILRFLIFQMLQLKDNRGAAANREKRWCLCSVDWESQEINNKVLQQEEVRISYICAPIHP